MPPLKDLLAVVPMTGRVDVLVVRPARDRDAERRDEIDVVAGLGIRGDRRARGEPDPTGRRHVTLIQAEHLDVVGRLLGTDVRPEDTRRNVVVSGINLASLRDRWFTVGEVVLEGTGPCHPCSQMEARLGPGGYQAMRGHGGITARVHQGGTIRRHDPVRVLQRDGEVLVAED